MADASIHGPDQPGDQGEVRLVLRLDAAGANGKVSRRRPQRWQAEQDRGKQAVVLRRQVDGSSKYSFTPRSWSLCG